MNSKADLIEYKSWLKMFSKSFENIFHRAPTEEEIQIGWAEVEEA